MTPWCIVSESEPARVDQTVLQCGRNPTHLYDRGCGKEGGVLPKARGKCRVEHWIRSPSSLLQQLHG